MDRTKWERKRIEEVCEKASSNIVLNKIEGNVGDYPLYGASGYVKSVDFFHMERPYVGIVKDGAGVGRVGIYPARSSLVGTMQYILPKKDCLLQYLSYGLQSLHLDKHMSGATIPHIYFKNYGKEMIPFPPLPHQKAIVAELDKLNDVIALKRKQLADLDSLAQSLFYEMFGDPQVNEKGWEVKKLGEVCEIGTGSTPDRNNNSYYKGNNPWVKSTEVCNCAIYDVQEHISDDALIKTNCRLYPINTILMAMYGQGKTRGQIAILKIVASTNQAVAAILPSNCFKPEYLYEHLRLMYENIRLMARGGNQANLNLSLVKSIKVMLPPLPLQQSFAAKITKIEAEKQRVKSSLKDLETLLASRMQYWFDN
ncbi:MAG: restriction endonuclease subunit S [Prevotella sp.]|nr:restriction endonuclease subunit S [Prevotella sp.]